MTSAASGYPRTVASVHQLSPADARRIAVHAQLLDAERRPDCSIWCATSPCSSSTRSPRSLRAPTWWRGAASDRRTRRPSCASALADRTLIELQAVIRPAEDLALYRADMADWPGTGELRDWQRPAATGSRPTTRCRRDILERLSLRTAADARAPGHLRGALESTGWTNDRNVEKLLDFMVRARRGRGRRPAGTRAAVGPGARGSTPTTRSSRPTRRGAPRRAAAARPRHRPSPSAADSRWSRATSARSGEPAVVEGVKGEWRVDPSLLDRPFSGRTALLSPFDRLVHDRKRAVELFDFDYQLEMYKPAAKRRWGYYALPVLHRRPADRQGRRHRGPRGGRAAGRRDPRGRAVHQERGRGGRRELKDLARWLELDLALPG